MASSDAFLARFEKLHPKLIDLSLGRIERLLGKLGNPERRLPPVIHVAGTNGKGSTIAFMRAILEASGASVHVFTSPHLVRFHERIRLGRPGGGVLISEAELSDACAHIEAANGDDPITFFEITTAMAFDLFAARKADFVLLEVGLGGRGDSTNVILHPAASVITPVSIDHREFLGQTVEKIAAEKAGIIKKGAPVILASQDERAIAICLAAAERSGAGATIIGGQDFHAYEERGRMIFQEAEALIDLPLPRLMGRHQIVNAACAIATLRRVAARWLTPESIAKGLANADWPARFQRLSGKLAQLLPEGSELWLDGGHNQDGARALAETVSALEERSPRPLVLIAGTMARKDAGEILSPFVGLAQEFYAVPIASENARPPAALAEAARSLGLPGACAGGVSDTLRFIAARTWPKPPRVLIAGSLYLAGEVLEADGALPK